MPFKVIASKPRINDPSSRFCAETVGAESLEESVGARVVLGVPLDSGEVVILMCRRSWWMGAMVGVIAGAATAAGAGLLGNAMGRPLPLSSTALVGVAAGSALFAIDHLRRLYVLTDRRVIREDRKLMRSTHVESALGCVRTIKLVQNDVQRRVGDGAVVFETDQGVIVWSGVGDAERIHTIAQEAVNRFGGGRRGM